MEGFSPPICPLSQIRNLGIILVSFSVNSPVYQYLFYNMLTRTEYNILVTLDRVELARYLNTVLYDVIREHIK